MTAVMTEGRADNRAIVLATALDEMMVAVTWGKMNDVRSGAVTRPMGGF